MSNEWEIILTQTILYFILLVVILGVSANSLLIFLFIRHSKLRTGSNILILNLAIADFFHIAINGIATFLVFNKFVIFSEFVCKLEESFRLTSVGVSVWSVVALSVHRYKTITSNINISTMKLAQVFLAIVWISALGFAIPFSSRVTSGYGNRCMTTLNLKLVTLFSLLVYSLIPLSIMVFMYILTALKLKESAETMPGERVGLEEQANARRRGARVFVALALVSLFSYAPLLVMIFVNTWFGGSIKPIFLLFGALCHFTSSVANPVALCITSKKIRTGVKSYILCSQLFGNVNMRRRLSDMSDFLVSWRISRTRTGSGGDNVTV